MFPANANDERPQYIVFDKTTGRVLHIHSRFSVEENKYVEMPIDELKATLGKDPSIVDSLTGKDAANLDILATKGGDRKAKTAMFKVDVKTRTVVSKPTLVLKAERPEIAGDGEDSTVIEIQATGENGKPDLNVDDTLKVTTSRGKLSARGGVVEMRQGRAQITLTSVKETVDRVQITATSVAGACGRGSLKLEFF